jgi:hypothetical protein
VGKGTLTTWKILRVAFNLLLEAFPRDNRLHRARFAKTHEVAQILSPAPRSNALLLGTRTGDIVAVSDKGALRAWQPSRCRPDQRRQGPACCQPAPDMEPLGYRQRYQGGPIYPDRRLDRPLARSSSSTPPALATTSTPCTRANQRTSFIPPPHISFIKPMKGKGQSSHKEQLSC